MIESTTDNPFLDRFTRTTKRQCAGCGHEFQALGLTAFCDDCGSRAPKPKAITIRDLGDSWPERHRQKLAAMAGQGLAKAKELLPRALDGGMIVLTGDRGRGKTQIATWLAWQRGQLGKAPGRYAKAFDLFSDVKASWAKSSSDSETKVMDRYKQAAFLALDECHERGETDWENRTLRNVLDHRYDAMLPTVILGNWAKAEDIGASLGASITDRISETGGIVWCRWKSYRVAAATRQSGGGESSEF